MQGPLTSKIPVFALVLLTTAAGTGVASAQLFPYDYYGGWGGYPYDTAATYRTNMNIASQQQQRAASRAMEQNRTVQMGIRSSLDSQATAQAQSQVTEAQRARDFWMQQQGRQMAQSRARAARPPVSLAGAARVAEGLTGGAAAASPSIIKWPPALMDPRFAAQRAKIEAPFLRRAADGGVVTIGEYEEIIKTTGEMKVTLKQLVDEISAGDYLRVEKFLDTMADEARQEIKVRQEAAAKQARPAETPAAAG